MAKYSFFLFFVFPIYLTVVASVNIQSTVFEGIHSSISELEKPFEKIGENYYIIETSNKTTWLGAAHFCRTKGAHLASIETENEWNAISSHLLSKEINVEERFWIDGSNIDELPKFFLISTGQPMSYSKWSPGQPDNAGNERCVQLWRGMVPFTEIYDTFLMNDCSCSYKAYIICKADAPKTVSMIVW